MGKVSFKGEGGQMVEFDPAGEWRVLAKAVESLMEAGKLKDRRIFYEIPSDKINDQTEEGPSSKYQDNGDIGDKGDDDLNPLMKWAS